MHAVASATLAHKEKSLNATWSIKVLAGNLGQDTTGEPGKNSTRPRLIICIHLWNIVELFVLEAFF